MEELDPQSCDCPNDCNSIQYNIGIKESPLDVKDICDSYDVVGQSDLSKRYIELQIKIYIFLYTLNFCICVSKQ